MKVSVIGTGYVGLVSGVCLAEKGHQVICVDQDHDKVDKINRCISTIYEKGLDDLIRKNINRTMTATTDLQGAVLETDISMIAVGTPFNGENIDLTCIRDVSRQIGTALKNKTTYHLIVVKSTVVPGTTDEVVLPILEKASGKKAGVDFGIGMNPEFLREGEAVQDFLSPDRIVLGGMDERSIEVLEELYSVFGHADKLKTNNRTAEMIKYTANSLLATMISFSNEIANLCSILSSVDVVDVMKGVHLDKRLCPILADGSRLVPSFTTYLEAGCGFGGSCFPKDVKALIAHGKKLGMSMQLLDAVIRVNEEQPRRVISLLRENFPVLSGVNIAVLGLAFKPGTDDLRESPALPIVRELLSCGARIRAYDPVANRGAGKILGNENITYCDDLAQAVDGSQAVLLLTRWEEFKDLPKMLSSVSPQPLCIDGRRMLDKTSVQHYKGIGLGS